MPDFLAEALTWPKNYTSMLAVQTAMDMKLPPTLMLLDKKQPTDPWTQQDKKLAVAWTILNKETCKECGNPLWICRSENKYLGFKVQKAHCYAKAELQKWEGSAAGKNLKPGDYPYVVPKMYDKEMSLPTRSEYIEQLIEDSE